MGFDVAVIGGGIIGTAAAAFLAEAGRTVVLLERTAIAAAASGRNSGVLQDPYDPPLSALHRESVALYHELSSAELGFVMGDRPAGLLLVGHADRATWPCDVAQLGAIASAGNAPEVLEPTQARRLEPALGEGVAAIRLETGFPVVPAAATAAYAARARRAGAMLHIPADARPLIRGGRVVGVLLADSGEQISCEQLLVAAGPWSAALIAGWRERSPIRPTYGVVAATKLDAPPRHVLEEVGIDPGASASSAFTLVTADGVSSVGSTFLVSEPKGKEWAAQLIERGSTFVPALAVAHVAAVRVCARPVSFDGRPLIGAVDADGLFVCAGHGPWGMSTGPASARLVVDEMLGRSGDDAPIDGLRASRWSSTVSQPPTATD